MMQYPTIRDLGQSRLADLHAQARRDALAHAARRPRSTRRPPRLLAALTGWARRGAPASCHPIGRHDSVALRREC